AKDTVILQLKEKLRSLKGDVTKRNVKREVEEIETINIELDHKVTKLVAENEHLKQTYKQLYDSIKSSRVRSKEQYDDLIHKVNLKSAEVSDLNANEAATLREIVESERLLSPLNTSLDYACKYTRRIQELLMILQQTCPSLTELGTKLVAVTPKNKTKQIRPTEQLTKSGKTTVTKPPSVNLDSNTPVLSSTGVILVSRVILVSSASGSMSQDNTKKNRIQRTQRKAKKNKVEDHLRNVKSSLNKKSVVDSKATSCVLNYVSNVNSDLKCASYNGCLFSDNHVLLTISNLIATPTIVPPREPIPIVNSMDKPVVTLVYTRKPKASNKKVPNKLEPNNSWGSSSSNVPSSLHTCKLSKSSSGTWTPIMGYGDYQIGNVTISRVYYMEGLGHDLFFVGQFCDSDLKVAFRQHTCFIRNLEGVNLLTGSRGNNLYTLSLQDMMASSPICLLSKASKTKSWLWHHRLSHLDFGAINHLARQGLVRGLSKLKFEKDYLFLACAMGKSTKKTHKPKSEDTNQEKLYLFHMDLCGPMRVESVNGKIRRIRTDNGTEFVNQTLRDYYEEVGISHETSVTRSPQQNESSSGPALNDMTPGTISSGLVQPSSSSTSFVPPSRNDWDLLFQPMLQLHEQALYCYYDAFLTSVEPKTYKEALTQACWIEAMQEELNEFERLEVWELVPRPDKVMVITLKWIYKVNLDELGGILKNKARLVARGYR
nr:retrovirus-related Pol polyprotein from transposon TNT 1-94 [Tanacetum cinerariifolium]